MTTVESWLAAAVADAQRRGMSELKPLLETLARSTGELRKAYSTLHDSSSTSRPHDAGTAGE